MIFGVVGGNGVQTTIIEQLRRTGNEVSWHIRARTNTKNTSIDTNIDVVLVLVDYAGHYLYNFAKTFCSKNNIVFKNGSIQWAKTYEGLKQMLTEEKLFKDKLFLETGKHYITSNESNKVFTPGPAMKIPFLIANGKLKCFQKAIPGPHPWRFVAEEDLALLGFTYKDARRKYGTETKENKHEIKPTTIIVPPVVKPQASAPISATAEPVLAEFSASQATQSVVDLPVQETDSVSSEIKSVIDSLYPAGSAAKFWEAEKKPYSIFRVMRSDIEVKEYLMDTEDPESIIELDAEEQFEKLSATIREISYIVYENPVIYRVKRSVKIERC